MKTIKETPRKLLRYLMFAKKNGVKLENPIVSIKKDKQIISYFEKHENFTNWNDFDIKWDIGMGDDIVAQSNRAEKWFLFNKGKEEIIKRPDDYWEKEAVNKNTSTHNLFILECKKRGITMEEFFKLFF